MANYYAYGGYDFDSANRFNVADNPDNSSPPIDLADAGWTLLTYGSGSLDSNGNLTAAHPSDYIAASSPAYGATTVPGITVTLSTDHHYDPTHNNRGAGYVTSIAARMIVPGGALPRSTTGTGSGPNYTPDYTLYVRNLRVDTAAPYDHLPIGDLSPGQNPTQSGGGTTSPALKQPGALALDGPRQWLHVARAKVKTVTTYHAADFTAAFTSPAYSVDYFAALRTDPRRAALHLLAFSGASALVFRSADGGMTATQGVSVTTTNAVLEVLSEKGIVLLLYTDATAAGTAGNVSAQISPDGGNTWAAAAPSSYGGARLSAVLSDLTYDPRRNALDLLCTVGTNTVVLESQDVGLTWTQKL